MGRFVEGDGDASSPTTLSKLALVSRHSRRSTIEYNCLQSTPMSTPRPLLLVDIDDEIMGGMPVFRGTRVPLDVVTDSLDKGIPFERLKASYPFLTPELADATRAYQLAHPRPGRQSIAEIHPDWTATEVRVVRPPRVEGGLK